VHRRDPLRQQHFSPAETEASDPTGGYLCTQLLVAGEARPLDSVFDRL
jgi:hypothetical protein